MGGPLHRIDNLDSDRNQPTTEHQLAPDAHRPTPLHNTLETLHTDAKLQDRGVTGFNFEQKILPMSDLTPTGSATPDPITNLVPDSAPSEQRDSRLRFLYEILPRIPTGTREDLTAICQAWLKATGAKWIWLWLKHSDENGDKNPWELTAVAAQDGEIENYIPDKDEFFSIVSDKNCVAKFTNLINRPVFIDDIEKWVRTREEDGRHVRYEVYAKEEFQRPNRNCISMLSVPLIFREPSKQPTNGMGSYANIRSLLGLVCAHFDTKKSPEELQDEESYKIMAQATAAAIVSSFTENQRNMLNQMDVLATEYLTRDGSTEKSRKDYLERAISLIRQHLQVDCASVFYKTFFNEDEIQCIASTGLYRDGGSDRVADAELSSICYRKGTGLTGITYETNRPHISQIGSQRQRPVEFPRCKSSEYANDCKLAKLKHSWVCYPISVITKAEDQGPSVRSVVGVLRCVGNKSKLKREFQRNFDTIQLQAIDFIASQLAPVLETMFNQIRRERYVTIIKHDIYNPLRLIDAGIDSIVNNFAPERLPLHWEDKMTFSLKLAKNLVGGLSEKESFMKRPTYFLRDVIYPTLSGLRYYAEIENRMKMGSVVEKLPANDSKKDKRPSVCLNIDPELVERAFLNVVINAVKYGKPGSEIQITCEQTGTDYCLHISNEGDGVDSDEREKIFIGEYRSPRVRNFKQGLGLGLKIAKAAMERNGGRLELTTNRNPTTFTLIFPNNLKVK